MMRAATIMRKPVAVAHAGTDEEQDGGGSAASYVETIGGVPIDRAPTQEPMSTDEVMKPVCETDRPVGFDQRRKRRK